MTAVLTEPLAPGIHRELDEATYHRAPGLSYSGAKVLLDAPARYRYERDHPPTPKREYDLGKVAHALILGKGEDFYVVDDVTDWRTKAAQAKRDKARADGLIPILGHEYTAACSMMLAVRASPAAQLFNLGEAEVSLSWVDEQTGVPLRGRVDWLHPNAIVDVKTCEKASPAAIRRAVYDFGYTIQAAAYSEGVRANGLGAQPFIFVFVEKTAPHLVTVAQLDEDAYAYGERRWRDAIDLYDACVQADNWPAYAADIETISLPAWAK